MLRGLSFPFPILFGMMLFLAMLNISSGCIHLSSVNAEEVDNGGDLYYGAAFKELENLIKNFDYIFDIEGSQIFLDRLPNRICFNLHFCDSNNI
jgi:hypothetical protein